MPFTFSHPAIILPLTYIDKKKLSVTAMTVGSLTPDFEYFFNFKQDSIYSHTWLGVLWFDLPLSLVLFYIYNSLVKDELIDNLPPFLNKRFYRFKFLSKRLRSNNILVIVVSLLIGITSHLFWDKLTHHSVKLVDEPMKYYAVFWDAGSVIGAAIIAFFILKVPEGTESKKQDVFLFWFVLLLIILIVLIIRSVFSTEIRDLGVSAISGFFMGLIITSIIQKAKTGIKL